MTNRSAEAVVFNCKASMAALVPYVISGSAAVFACAAMGIWQLGAIICGTLVIYGFSYVSPGGLTLTNVCIKNEKASISLDIIKSVAFEQSFIGKLLGYGTIVIYTPRRRLRFCGLSRAEAMRDRISKQIDLYCFKQTCLQAEAALQIMSNDK